VTRDISIRFIARPDSPHIVQVPSHCCSILGAADKAVPGIRIEEVFTADGPTGPRKFRRQDDGSVVISPPVGAFQAVTLRCSAPDVPSKPFSGPVATSHTPDLRTGLLPRS
jgi:hypothetical protein